VVLSLTFTCVILQTNNKNKEKKEQRKKEVEKAQTQKAALTSISSIEDLLESFPLFKKYDRNGLAVDIEYQPVQKLSQELRDWTFTLLKDNMFKFYEAVWGWHDTQKKKELSHEESKYLIAFDRESRKPLGYVHFRFEYEDDLLGCYVYEMQMEPAIQSKGLGKFLMQLCELVSIKYQMQHVLLTVFTSNERARNFYVDKLKYEVHEKSPSKYDPLSEVKYDILCKKLPQTKKQ